MTIRLPAAMANPIQQGLKPDLLQAIAACQTAAMANPIQQGLKLADLGAIGGLTAQPQWLIQYNKD